jgi:UDP-2-acetamido-2-deoxy-ribo-hexuluronate aminotransferase
MEFRDLKSQYQKYKNEIDEAINKVLVESNFISGHQVQSLEMRLAEYVGVKHCITCANGTDALSLVLKAWNVGKGDAVFVPNFTFFATAEVVSYAGATPIFVDVNANTFNIDSEKLVEKIEEVIFKKKLKPQVIIPVDLFGLLANYDQISIIAKKFNLLVLEDAAQGFGASYKNKRAGSFGDAATTSFFPAKPLGCYGDGGAIFTNDDSLASLIESLRVHGKGHDKYDNVRIGVNSRLDTLQAAILEVKFDAFINHELDDVNNNFKRYNSLLKGIVDIPYIPENYLSSFAQYTIKLKSKKQRDELKHYLSTKGIPSMIYYSKTMHNQSAFLDLNNSDGDYTVSIDLCNKVLSLPMHPYLKESDVELVATSIIEFLSNSSY